MFDYGIGQIPGFLQFGGRALCAVNKDSRKKLQVTWEAHKTV